VFLPSGNGKARCLLEVRSKSALGENTKRGVEYKIFYAVVYFQEKAELNPESFRIAVKEKSFPENWIIIAI